MYVLNEAQSEWSVFPIMTIHPVTGVAKPVVEHVVHSSSQPIWPVNEIFISVDAILVNDV